MHVAECQRRHVAAVLAGAERLDRTQGVLGRGVELVVDRADDTVFFATDDADLDLEHDLGGRGLLEELARDREVLLQRHRGAVPHVRLEQGELAAVDPLLGDREQWPDEAVELVLGAVVGMQGDVDRVLLGRLVRERSEGHETRPPCP